MADVRSNGERILVVIALTCVLSGACVFPFFHETKQRLRALTNKLCRSTGRLLVLYVWCFC